MEYYLGKIYRFKSNYSIEGGEDYAKKEHFFILTGIELGYYYFVPVTSKLKGFETQYVIPRDKRPFILQSDHCESVVNCNRLILVPYYYLINLTDTGDSLNLEEAFNICSKINTFYLNGKVKYIPYIPFN